MPIFERLGPSLIWLLWVHRQPLCGPGFKHDGGGLSIAGGAATLDRLSHPAEAGRSAAVG